MSDTYTSEQHDQPFTMSPGEQLKRRREQLNISVEEAADALHLRPAVIAGLEHDSYDEIPVPTYRRGYLRAYARYLDIDEGPVLDAYKARNGTQEAERKVTPVSMSRPPSRLGALLFKLVTLLVIIGLITVTVMWWQSRGGSTPPGLEDTGQLSSPNSSVSTSNAAASGTSTDNIMDSSTGSAASNEPSSNNRSSSVDTASDEGAESNATVTQAPSDEDDVSTADASTSAQEDDTAETTASTSSDTATPDETATDGTLQDDAAAVAATEDTADTEESATTEDVATADESNTRLELTFNQQSWTEIFDATNQRVFVGLQEPGTSATVEGEPPYRLTIGNSTGVELRYRGEVVNLRERAGANNVARFTLGE